MAQQFAAPTTGEVPCSYHPDVMTGLRCSRCGKPICPRCAVRTPVGLRCPDCAGVRGLPTIRTSPNALARAGGLAMAVAALVTALWYLAPDWKFYLSLALGFGVAEAIAWIAKGKRGSDLQVLGIAIVTLAMVAVRLLLAQKYGIPIDLMLSSERVVVQEGGQLLAGMPRDFVQLRIVPDILFMALTWVIVWVRFR
ncbi:MAG TPA: B-box zinc finger protein [Thermomicrobiales bacterium]|nr:B-box zinc finger protein [Thermomicrobiales bacterium]